MIQKVLVVDNSQLDRFVAEQIIKKHGVKNILTVECASDALNYLTSIQSKPRQLPELILIELNMPSMNGFEFLNRLSKLGKAVRDKCKIFVLTSSLDSRLHGKALEIDQVCGLFKKPFRAGDLDAIYAQLQHHNKRSYWGSLKSLISIN